MVLQIWTLVPYLKHVGKYHVQNLALMPNETLQAVGVLQSQYAFSGLFYDAALEANPGLLDSISVDTVIGNSSHVLRQCKDPKVFFSTLDRYSIPYPEVSLAPLSNSHGFMANKTCCKYWRRRSKQ